MENPHFPHAMSSLATWLSYLEHLHPKTIDLDIVRITSVAHALDLLKPAPFIFTVAGTNGKGTTCCTLETLLLASGYRVGVYNSPHLLRYTERVRIQGVELPESVHTASFATIEAGRGDISLTYFEFGTLSALQLFKQAALDIVILEVGLGGRRDATNIVDTDIAIITNIALDHTDWLGSDMESIGLEKAGIFRSGKPAVVGIDELNMPRTIIHVAQEKGAKLLQLGRDWQWQEQKKSWTFSDSRMKLENLPLPQVPLPNAAIALAALSVSGLNISETVIHNHLDKAILPGRFQIVARAPKVILDVAHNPHAAIYLAKQLAQFPKKGIVHAVVGMFHDKDIVGTLVNLSSQVDNWYFASLEGPRGASAEQLLSALESNRAQIFSSVTTAWQVAMQQADKYDIILVCGSFHTVAHIMDIMGTEENSVK